MTLSIWRAQFVENYLMQEGVRPMRRLLLRGCGSKTPLAFDPAKGNDKVEILLVPDSWKLGGAL
jgi:outer membrane protein OmpA-like peptidoglycan-associated protein